MLSRMSIPGAWWSVDRRYVYTWSLMVLSRMSILGAWWSVDRRYVYTWSLVVLCRMSIDSIPIAKGKLIALSLL